MVSKAKEPKESKRFVQLSTQAVPMINQLYAPLEWGRAVDVFSEHFSLPKDSVDAALTQLIQANVLQEDDGGYRHQTTYYGSGYANLLNQRSMLQDHARTDAFKKAIEECVTPNSRVIDVGSGSGILSLFAASAGAKKVHSIECTKVIEAAKVIALRNKLDHKIDFFSGDAASFTLRSKADVIVSEWIGYFVMEEYMYQAFQVVRDRYLKPGGKVIPSHVRMYLTPLEDSELYYHSGLGFWESSVYGYDFSFAKRCQLAKISNVLTSIRPAACIAPPWEILQVDCLKDDADVFLFEKSGEMIVERAANFHGFAGHFELDLSPSVTLSTSPFAVQTHWQQVYFPTEQYQLEKGDKIRVKMISRRGRVKPIVELQVRILRGRKVVHSFSHVYNEE